jgi:anion-transporting  ArsA/GET3 family ATPase
MTVYAPLQSYLSQRTESSVVMTYAEIESLLGRKLPPTAYGDHRRQWWANTETHSQALAWLRANRKTKLDVAGDKVAFIRADASSKQSVAAQHISQEARSEAWLQELAPAALRLLEDIAEEKDITLQEAAVELLNRAARQRRQATLDWFAANTLPSSTSSVDLIRADRDGR